MTKEIDNRYPYTYANDMIRSIPHLDCNGVKLSRSEAAQIRRKIADIIGMSDKELAEKIADYYLKNKDGIIDQNYTRMSDLIKTITEKVLIPND